MTEEATFKVTVHAPKDRYRRAGIGFNKGENVVTATQDQIEAMQADPRLKVMEVADALDTTPGAVDDAMPGAADDATPGAADDATPGAADEATSDVKPGVKKTRAKPTAKTSKPTTGADA